MLDALAKAQLCWLQPLSRPRSADVLVLPTLVLDSLANDGKVRADTHHLRHGRRQRGGERKRAATGYFE